MKSYQWINELITGHSDAVLVTILETKGSAPREAGTKMVVTGQGIQGTIGGGHLEHQCISKAIERLAQTSDHHWHREILHFPFGVRLGRPDGGFIVIMLEYIEIANTWLKELSTMVRDQQSVLLVTPLDPTQNKFLISQERDNCQQFPEHIRDKCQRTANELLDSATLENRKLSEHSDAPETNSYFFEKFAPSRFHIMLFGAGHVGRALIRKLEDIDCKISWVDSRAEQFPSDLPSNTVRIISDQPEEVAAKAPANTYFLIMTHSHQIDQRVCEAVLTRNDFRLCGLIGSATKRRKFEDRLRAKGISDGVLDKLTCPIGISGITGKEPAVIAISVAAQLLGRAIWANQTA